MVKNKLRELTKHKYIYLVDRGNTAIRIVLEKFSKVLIPSEGGWLSYKKFGTGEVNCVDAVVDLEDLKNKVSEFDVFIYQNPGGYFAEQPMKEIYKICSVNKCKVVIDVTGSVGTTLCDGKYADYLVCSFGKWKLLDVGEGGFLSSNEKLDVDGVKINGLPENLEKLESRIEDLTLRRKKIIDDLKKFNVLRKNDFGLVVVVEFNNETEKENLIKYCTENKLEWTESPRYIRVNKKAISIEVKRL